MEHLSRLLAERRLKYHQKKQKDLADHYQKRFNEYLNLYFSQLTGREEEDEMIFNIIKKDWIKYCQEANSSQKYMVLKVKSFEEEVTRIKKEIKDKEVVDITKLNDK